VNLEHSGISQMYGRLILSLKPKHKDVLEREWLAAEIKELGEIWGKCMTSLTFPSFFSPVAVTLDKALQGNLSNDE